MTNRSCLAIILAAGEGTRMRSSRPKVLHPIGGLPMIGHVVASLSRAGLSDIAVVIGPGHDAVAQSVQAMEPGAEIVTQSERLGTAHAVLAARQTLERGYDEVVIVFGDTPFVTTSTITALREGIGTGSDIVVAGMRPGDPAEYGRLILSGDQLLAIREFKDTSLEERKIDFCNGGIMAINGGEALSLLDAVTNDNAKGEYYLTDIVEIANQRRLTVTAREVSEAEIFGINTKAQLALAERRFQDLSRSNALENGATLIDPDTVYFSFDTEIASDVTVEPHVVFAPGVRVAQGATVRAFSHLEQATVAAGAIIGPFARLRPGSQVGEGARVGNFCEIKNSEIGAGTKINHLSYIGDTEIGENANIGAGTITCNYDGVNKYRTLIGNGVFVGSNTALVAPVSVGDGAYVASGSVITDDIAADSLAIARGRQVEKPGRAAAMRDAMQKPRQKG